MARALKGTLDQRQQPTGGLHRLQEFGEPVSPYLRTDAAARYLQFASAHLFRKWAARAGVPVCRTGRTLLYDRRVLDDFVAQKDWTKRRTA